MEENSQEKTSETEPETPSYDIRSDEELRKLAVDIVAGNVFGTWSIDGGWSNDIVRSVFMVIGLGGLSAGLIELLNNDPRFDGENTKVHVDEFMSEAGPRSINGYPIFMSLNLLLGDDVDKVFEYADELLAKEEEFLNGREGESTEDYCI